MNDNRRLLDDFMEEENIETIYRAKGLKGVMEIPGIGGSLTNQIEIFLTTP